MNKLQQILHREDNQNFNKRFKEHRKEFIYTEGIFKFCDYGVQEGHKMKPTEDTMTIITLKTTMEKQTYCSSHGNFESGLPLLETYSMTSSIAEVILPSASA